MSNQPYSPDPRGYQQPPMRVPSEQGPYGAADDTIESSNSPRAYAQSRREGYVDPMVNRVENPRDGASSSGSWVRTRAAALSCSCTT